jgi:2-polyprenyl-3-methyl-5-hydroxy-6-metoxy-1,4-benzoquinol methylase
MAYGVDPRRKEKYSLRQSRYYVLSHDVSRLAGEAKQRGERLKLLDIGVGRGVTMRYVEVQPDADNIDFYGADLEVMGVYRHDDWKHLWQGDFMAGYPDIPDAMFDVVVCEQVLEHLPELPQAVKALERLLKPGGTLIVGVPIFPEGLDLMRRHFVPVWDRAVGTTKQRGHVQAFSLRSFKRLLRTHTDLEIVQARGFRIVSGGLLRPLENHRWWWRFNKRLGELLPALCIEIQIVARKPLSAPTTS